MLVNDKGLGKERKHFHLPMHKHPAFTSVVAGSFGPVVETLMNEGIAPWKIRQDIGVVDIIQGNA